MNRTLVLQKTPETALIPPSPQCSETARTRYGIARSAKKVLGIKSLCRFLAVSYRQLGVLIAAHTGRVYTKGAIGTWAMYEQRDRIPKKYKMPRQVCDALHQIFREFIYSLVGESYRVSVRGSYHWRVEVKRV